MLIVWRNYSDIKKWRPAAVVAFLLCLKRDPNCCFHVLCRMETEEEKNKQTNKQKKEMSDDPSRPVPAYRERDPREMLANP